jgi:hypothetical protein
MSLAVSEHTLRVCVVVCSQSSTPAAQIYGGVSAGAEALRGAVRMRDETQHVAGVQTESKRTCLAVPCLLHHRLLETLAWTKGAEGFLASPLGARR